MHWVGEKETKRKNFPISLPPPLSRDVSLKNLSVSTFGTGERGEEREGADLEADRGGRRDGEGEARKGKEEEEEEVPSVGGEGKSPSPLPPS